MISIDDLAQCNSMMRSTYTLKIAKKYSQIQGTEINSYQDLNQDGKNEYKELVREYPMNVDALVKIIKKRGK